ncbi:MAG TPA: peptidyl-prolyl cis-trans isomerase [Candidatus Polarisedimenticolia bacterium]|nr:peptidyl-prolyl cis-trans isomerase [Candidatus Polarisedimenticolia bacterium]
MLNVFRENLRHLKWILLLVVFSFILTIYAVWGGGLARVDNGREGVEAWAAKVDGEVISIQSFQNAARNLEASYRQLLGAQYEQQRAFLRVGQAAIHQLVDEKLLAREAEKAGLSVSEQEVADTIMKDTSLQQNGAFIGRDRYEKLYRSNPVLFENYEDSVKRQVLLNKLRSLLEDSVTLTEDETKEAFRRQNEKATFEVLRIDASKLSVPSASAAMVEAYYKAHVSDYPSGEGRSGRYALFDAKDIASGMDVTESEIRSRYLQDQKTLYTTPEKRRASHILFKVSSDAPQEQVKAAEGKARKALQRVRSGEDFAKVAKEISEDSTASSGGDVGYFTRDQMVREFAEAAWGLGVGQTSDPVRSPFGFHVIRLTDLQAAKEIPLEGARPQILASLKEARAHEEAQRRASDFSARVQSAGGDFQKAAREAGIATKEFTGVHPGEPIGTLGIQAAASSALFALKRADTSPPVPVTSGVAVLQYREPTPSAPLPLEKVRDRVSRDVTLQLRVDATRKIIDAAGGTANLSALAKKLKSELKNTGSIGRNGPAADLGSDASLMEKIFALPVGGISSPLPLPDGSTAIVRMVQKPDPLEGFEAQKGSLRESLLLAKKDRLFRAYLERLRAAHPAEINTVLVAQADKT